MDFNFARFNMVHQQVRPWNVLDPTILQLFETIPRENFIPKELEDLAFSDTFLPIGYGQVALPPKMIGRFLQGLEITHQESVLQVGTGTGYISAFLCHLAKKVVGIECVPELLEKTQTNLEHLHLKNIRFQLGNGSQGIPNGSLFDVILLTGSVPTLPTLLKTQLAPEGRLLAVVGQAPIMQVLLVTKISKTEFKETVLFETEIPPLLHSTKPEIFTF